LEVSIKKTPTSGRLANYEQVGHFGSPVPGDVMTNPPISRGCSFARPQHTLHSQRLHFEHAQPITALVPHLSHTAFCFAIFPLFSFCSVLSGVAIAKALSRWLAARKTSAANFPWSVLIASSPPFSPSSPPPLRTEFNTIKSTKCDAFRTGSVLNRPVNKRGLSTGERGEFAIVNLGIDLNPLRVTAFSYGQHRVIQIRRALFGL